METFVKGDVVVFPFPFAELTESKKIFGKRDGQDIFRATIVLRLEE